MSGGAMGQGPWTIDQPDMSSLTPATPFVAPDNSRSLRWAWINAVFSGAIIGLVVLAAFLFFNEALR